MSSLIYCKSVYILLPNDVINVGILYKVHDVKQNLTAIVMGQEITMLESIIQNPMQNYNRKGRTISTVAQCRTSYLSAISGRKSVSKPHTYFSEWSWQDMPLEPGMQKDILEPRSQFCRWKFYTHSLLLPEIKDQSCNIWQVFLKIVSRTSFQHSKYFTSLVAWKKNEKG